MCSHSVSTFTSVSKSMSVTVSFFAIFRFDNDVPNQNLKRNERYGLIDVFSILMAQFKPLTLVFVVTRLLTIIFFLTD